MKSLDLWIREARERSGVVDGAQLDEVRREDIKAQGRAQAS